MTENKYSALINNITDDDWTIVEGKKKINYYIPKINCKQLDQTEKNQKKILCNNILKFKKCTYGNKCMYAHCLEEQNVDPIKKRAYSILRSEGNIDIDLSRDEKLSKVFLQFTKLCNDCKNKVCPGGYNCKYGAIEEKYLICYDDLMSGNCKKNDCTYIHLTNRGIKPIIQNVKPKNEIIFSKKKNYIDMVNGTVLNDDFFVSLNLEKRDVSDVDSEGESTESIEKIKEYLDEYDSDENCDESIFVYTK